MLIRTSVQALQNKLIKNRLDNKYLKFKTIITTYIPRNIASNVKFRVANT